MAERIGLQLYSVRELAEQDLPGVLEAVARIGYEGVEFAGLHGHPAAAVREVIDRLGLAAVGAHLSLEDLEERPEQTLADLRTLGCRTAIVAWLPPERYADAATARQTVERLLAAGDVVRAAGLRFAYHNHAFEFDPIPGTSGTTLWSLLLESPAHRLPLEIDVYWVRHAGRDPAQLIAELGARVSLIHAKDTEASPAADATAAGDCAVGTGVERWADLLGACRSAGVEWLVVEQERSRDILADVATSLGSLRRLLA